MTIEPRFGGVLSLGTKLSCMSQVVIVIDVPEVDADQLAGHSMIQVGEDAARAIRKQLPVDDAVRLAYVAVGDDSMQHVVVDRLRIASDIVVDVPDDEEPVEVSPEAEDVEPATAEPEWVAAQQEEIELREDEAEQDSE
jgi:hypothetical protein